MIYFAFALVAFLSFFTGHFLRELKELMLTIKNKVGELYVAQKAEEQKAKEKPMSFAGPVNLDEMTDQEKIDYLNP